MAYSQDIQLPVTAAVAAGMLRRDAAVRFAVSPSAAIRWAEREGTPGRRVRQPTGGGRVARHLAVLLAEIAATPDMTMPELAARLLLDEIATWQARPLDPVHPLVFFDALRVTIRDEGLVRNQAVHIALGVRVDGAKEVLGLWLQLSRNCRRDGHSLAGLSPGWGVSSSPGQS
jgi:hypothetical protein